MTTKTKELSDGARIGRALTKLAKLRDDEAAELHRTPAAIREKFAARRLDLLTELAPHIRKAVEAADRATSQEAAQ